MKSKCITVNIEIILITAKLSNNIMLITTKLSSNIMLLFILLFNILYHRDWLGAKSHPNQFYRT